MFKALKIQDTNYKFQNWEEFEINGLKKINIFVGQNNSGKSRFMRSIFTNEVLFKDEYYEITNSFLTSFNDKTNSYLWSIRSDLNGFKRKINSNLNEQYNKEDNLFYSGIISLNQDITNFQVNNTTSVGGVYYSSIWTVLLNKWNEAINETEFNIDDTIVEITKKVYISMPRGLKNPRLGDNTDLYSIRTKKDYFEKTENTKFEIFTWLNLYEQVREMKSWTDDQIENIEDFQKFLSKNFFNWERVLLNPRHKKDVLYVKIWEKEQRPIFDLWDWIQTIIINTFPLFKYQNEDLQLFIEEPETGIHPWMQRILLKTFANWIEWQKWEHQIYFTTHSNHFLDIALDSEVNDNVSIYQFDETEKEDEKHIKNITQNKEVLDLLGVRNSSVFLSNCIIWVEWISDRLYVRKFLELYQKDKLRKVVFEEDKHYSVLEYGWSNISHFDFWEKKFDTINTDGINLNNFVVADNDWFEYTGAIKSSDEKKVKRLKTLKRILKNKFYCEHREIENLLWLTVLKDYISNIDYSNKDIELNIRNMWLIDWTKSIGEILKKHFISKKSWKNPVYFRKKHIECLWETKTNISINITKNYINSFDDLPEETQKFTKKLYKFIKENNK